MSRYLYRTAIALACTILTISTTFAQRDTTGLKITLPADVKFVNSKPAGKGWVNLLDIKKTKPATRILEI